MSAPGGAAVPEALAEAVEERVAEQPLRALAAAADAMSRRYREAVADPLPSPTRLDVDAYLTVRLPATYAAVHRVLEETADTLPGFRPSTLLDAGAGPGTAAWAATAAWPGIDAITLLERAREFTTAGRELAAGAPEPALRDAEWRDADLRSVTPPTADLVVAAFALVELGAAARTSAVGRLWAAAASVLVVVEPGTPAAATGLLDLRRELVALGAHVVAPCPHDDRCPYDGGEVPDGAPGWCHSSVRIARSRRHRLVKGAEAGFEDERFCYLVALRPGAPGSTPVHRAQARVLAPPVRRGGGIELSTCTPEGLVVDVARGKAAQRELRRVRWGDGLDRRG